MRHHNQNRKLGRVRNQRKALLNSLARSLILKGKIQTTLPKAKELRPFVEKIVTVGKTPTVANRRAITTKVGREAAKKVVDTLSKNYEKRSGGYARILKTGRRTSDGASMAIIELI